MCYDYRLGVSEQTLAVNSLGVGVAVRIKYYQVGWVSILVQGTLASDKLA